MSKNDVETPDTSLYYKDPRNRAIIEKKKKKSKARKLRDQESIDSVVSRYKDLDQVIYFMGVKPFPCIFKFLSYLMKRRWKGCV